MSDPNWPPPAPPEYAAGGSGLPVPGDSAGWGARFGATLIDTIILIASSSSR